MKNAMRNMFPGMVIVAVLGTVLFAGGCSQWQFVRDKADGKGTTLVRIRTEPPGADISVNGNAIGVSNLEVPIRYPSRVGLYQRREYLPYPHVAETEIESFYKNDFTITAYLVGYFPMKTTITLNGEPTKDVVIRLRKKPE
jgi:hypothetical protein